MSISDEKITVSMSFDQIYHMMAALGYKAEEIKDRTGTGFTATDRIAKDTNEAIEAVLESVKEDSTLVTAFSNAANMGRSHCKQDKRLKGLM